MNTKQRKALAQRSSSWWRALLVSLTPRSILGLVLVGFLFVTLPLIASLVRAVFYVDDLVLQSEQLVVHGMQVTRTSELLVEHISDMERNARQYQVLGEPALLQLYEEKQELFRARVDLLQRLAPKEANEQLFATLHDHSLAILEILRAQPIQENNLAAPPQSDDVAQLIEHFGELTRVAVGLANRSASNIREQLQTLFETASSARVGMYWQALALIPIALLLGLLFAVLITRPIRQLSDAIRSLGETKLTRRISVTGPPELRDLGQQLDWLRTRLLESEREKNQFLRQMSHELKTPLASVREGADLLADGTVGKLNENQNEVATIVRENSLELQLLIENLLSFSAWHEKRSRPTLEPVSLNSLFSELCHKFRMPIAAKQLDLRLPKTRSHCYADPSLLYTALENLVSNAIKFTPNGGAIAVKVKNTNQAVRIDVIDSGPGIAKHEKERIFEPFFKGKTPSGASLRGTGIGLSVANECVQAHGGKLEVIDESTGAHFRITLPNDPADDDEQRRVA